MDVRMTDKLHEKANEIRIGWGHQTGNTLSTRMFIAILEYSCKMINSDNKGITIVGEKFNHLHFLLLILLQASDLTSY